MTGHMDESVLNDDSECPAAVVDIGGPGTQLLVSASSRRNLTWKFRRQARMNSDWIGHIGSDSDSKHK